MENYHLNASEAFLIQITQIQVLHPSSTYHCLCFPLLQISVKNAVWESMVEEGDIVLQNLWSTLALPTHSPFLNDCIPLHPHIHKLQEPTSKCSGGLGRVTCVQHKGPGSHGAPSLEILKSHLDTVQVVFL